MWKVGGAKAALGSNLDEVIAAAQKAIDNTRSIGIGLTPCTIPAVGKPNFQIEPGKMELGIGHHGEPGIKVTDLATADEMAEMCLDTILWKKMRWLCLFPVWEPPRFLNCICFTGK